MIVTGMLVLSAATGSAHAMANVGEFANTAAVQIPPAKPCCEAKPASIYPSSIQVSGLEGVATNVAVTLHGISHQDIEDLAVLLVGPNRNGVVLAASYNQGRHEVWSNRTLTFEDLGEPVECPEPEGTFKGGSVWGPFDCGLLAPFPSPAPAGPYNHLLRDLATGGADGTWSLYVDNDAGEQEGSLGQGWSLRIQTLTSPPFNVAPPSISGTDQLGQALSCSQGSWLGIPSPSFSYQWLRDGSKIATATSSSYVLQSVDEGHTLTCEVTASNSVGQRSASAGFTVPASIPTTGGFTAGGSTTTMATISSAQVSSLLASQLTASATGLRIAPLSKRGAFTVTFRALEAGVAVIAWYEIQPRAKLARETKSKSVLIASGRVTFFAAGSKPLKIKLTTEGRRLLRHTSRVKLTARGTFTPAGKPPISATRTFVLRR
jgi:hypothetical protein